MISNVSECIALIPARSGSKSIVHKNIQSLAGKPLLSFSIETAKKVRQVKEVVVSTDSRFYGELARYHGARVPFLRPRSISGDGSTDREVIQHLLSKYRETRGESYNPIILLLRPTHPIRDSSFIETIVERYKSDSACMLRSVSPAEQTPYKMWKMSSDSRLERVIGKFEDRLHDSPRQKLPSIFWQDGYADVFMECALVEQFCENHQTKIKGVISPSNEIDVDYPEQLIAHENSLISSTEGKSEILKSRQIRSFDERRYGS